MRSAILLSFCFLVCGLLSAQQAPDAPQTFAVATIKPSAPDAVAVTQIRGNRFATEATTFVDVFKHAYNLHPEQVVGGPGWLRTERVRHSCRPRDGETAEFATFLQRFVLDRPAVDQTGIAGRFDLVLRWTPDNFRAGGKPGDLQEDASVPPNLFTAMKE